MVLTGVHVFPLTITPNIHFIIELANRPGPDNNPDTPSLPDNIETLNSSSDLQSISECTYPSTQSTNAPTIQSHDSDSNRTNSRTVSPESLNKKAVLFTKFLTDLQPAKHPKDTSKDHRYTKQSLAILHTDKSTKRFPNSTKFKSNISDFHAITHISIIPRCHSSILYAIDKFDSNYHGTIELHDNQSMSVFRSIFDHIPIQHIAYERNGYENKKDGIHIKTGSSNHSVSDLSKELA